MPTFLVFVAPPKFPSIQPSRARAPRRTNSYNDLNAFENGGGWADSGRFDGLAHSKGMTAGDSTATRASCLCSREILDLSKKNLFQKK